MSQPIIQVDNLTKTFKLKQKIPGFLGSLRSVWSPEYKFVKAVSNISFNVNQGEIVAFIGPNGAGKSTTIKMLTGILFPSSGAIQVLGLNPQRQRQELAYHIGSVFGQKPQLWYHLPPQDTYDLFSRIYELDQKEYQERLKYLVEMFEIEELLKTPVRKLSLGQRMRCEITASLLHRPKIIFLDEPTIGLDVIAKQRIREVIKHLNETEQVTIFLTSHDAGDVEALAQRTIVINHGKVLFDDTTEKFKADYIKSKTVELVTNTPAENFIFPGVTIIEKTEGTLRVELGINVSVQEFLAYAVKTFDIADINVYDPPMEEIIKGIYLEPRI